MTSQPRDISSRKVVMVRVNLAFPMQFLLRQRSCAEMAEEARRHRDASAVRENQTALVQQRVRVVENELEQVGG